MQKNFLENELSIENGGRMTSLRVKHETEPMFQQITDNQFLEFTPNKEEHSLFHELSIFPTNRLNCAITDVSKIEGYFYDQQNLTNKEEKNQILDVSFIKLEHLHYNLRTEIDTSEETQKHYMCSIGNQMSKSILKHIFYGKDPFESLMDGVKEKEISVEDCIQEMAEALKDITTKSKNFHNNIIIMRPEYFQAYCFALQKLQHNSNTMNSKQFLGAKIYCSDILDQNLHSCLVLNLKDNVVLAYNPQIQHRKFTEGFVQNSTFRLSFGFKTQNKKNDKKNDTKSLKTSETLNIKAFKIKQEE